MKIFNKNHLVIDCSSLVYAAFFAFGPVLTYNNKPTGVIYGFLRKILQLGRKFRTSKFYFCWDHPRNFRKDVYPIYKANRRTGLTPTEEQEYSLKDKQENELKDSTLRRMGFMNHFQQRGYESDDFMAVIAERLKTKKVLMVTADNDMWQCLEHCDIINPSTFKRMTEEKFISTYKVYPSQWPICKSIGGCTGDNVVGIKGCGDPKDLKKGPRSRTMQYVRGEISTGIIYDRINSNEGKKIIRKNLPIVTLPYMPEKMKEPFVRRDKCTRKKFIRVFDKYHFKSFLEEETFRQWEEVFLNAEKKSN